MKYNIDTFCRSFQVYLQEVYIFAIKTLSSISATSSSARGSPVNSSSSTLHSDAKKDGLQESRDNYHVGNFRAPPTRAVQVRFVPAKRSMGNELQRDQLCAPGIRGGPTLVAGSDERESSEIALPSTSNERHFLKDVPRRPVSYGNILYSHHLRSKDLQRIAEQEQLKLENLRDKGTRTPDKQLKQQRDKEFVSTDDRSLSQQIHAPHELQRSQLLFDSEYMFYPLKRTNIPSKLL